MKKSRQWVVIESVGFLRLRKCNKIRNFLRKKVGALKTEVRLGVINFQTIPLKKTKRKGLKVYSCLAHHPKINSHSVSKQVGGKFSETILAYHNL
jgi:hypothetical protein